MSTPKKLSASRSTHFLKIDQENNQRKMWNQISRSSSQALLTNGCDINNKYILLKNSVSTVKNLTDLIEISRVQQYMISTEKAATIFKLIGSTNPEISTLALQLIDRISSFSSYFLSSSITQEHASILYNLIPDDSATKALGKLVSAISSIGTYVASIQSFPELYTVFEQQQKLPLFIWFLSCFTSNKEANEIILPLFKEYVFHFALSDDSTIQKHALDALRVFSIESEENLQWVLENETLPDIIANIPEELTCLKVYLKFCIVLAEHAQINGTEEAIKLGLEAEVSEVIKLALQLLLISIHDGLHFEVFINDLFHLYQTSCNIIISEKVCSALCMIFQYMPTDIKQAFIDNGFLDILDQHIGTVGEDGIGALSSAYLYASTHSLEDITESIEMIAVHYDIAYETFELSA